MSRLHQRLATLLLVMVAGGCAGPSAEEALANWRDQARSTDARLDQLDAVDGRWSRGDADSTWRAWFDGDELVAVHEQLSFGEYGQRDGRLYFEDDVLRYYAAEGKGIAVGVDGGQELADVKREIVFDGSGREVAKREETDVGVASVDPNVVVGVRLHGAEIKREAERRRSRRPRNQETL